MNDKNKTLITLLSGIILYFLTFMSSGYGYKNLEIDDTYFYEFLENIIEEFTRGPDEIIAYAFWWLATFLYFYYLWKKRKQISNSIFNIIKKFYDKV